MDERIAYLMGQINRDTPDAAAYRALSEECRQDARTFEGKARFLERFAREIPIVADRSELIVGSMRIWRGRVESRNVGHIIVDYRFVLREGIAGLEGYALRLEGEYARGFKQALEAFKTYIRRHGESPNVHETAAKNCLALLEHAPGSFYEALQLVWFVHLFLHAEGMEAAVSFGRFDQYMEPFYRADRESGRLTQEEARRLLTCFWIKTNEGDESQNLTLGGDAENELTALCLEVTEQMHLPQPSVSVRFSKSSTQTIKTLTARIIVGGLGMPAVFNDAVIEASLRRLGVSDQDARNYAIVGCYEANADGCTFGTTANGSNIYLNRLLLDFLHEHSEEQAFASFEALYISFKDYVSRRYHSDIIEGFRVHWARIEEKASPFESLCMGDCLKSGRPAELGGCRYTMQGVNIVGLGTLVDSLYVLKRLVFEEKRYDYAFLLKQTFENFPQEDVRSACRRLPGKYGTDCVDTNDLARDMSNLLADLLDSEPIKPGVKAYGGLFVFTGDIYSAHEAATPDGRRDGERLSYGIAPSDSCTGRSVTSILSSAACLANDRFADGNPLLMTLEPSAVGEQGRILISLIDSYFEKGGFCLHFNVVGRDTLLEARRTPEEYGNLTVRISGFSAYFTQCNEAIQQALIERFV